MKTKFTSSLCVVILSIWGGGLASAADGSWIRPQNSNWDYAPNWEGEVVPGGVGASITVDRSYFTGGTAGKSQTITATVREPGLIFGHLHVFGQSSQGTRNFSINASGGDVGEGITLDAGAGETALIKNEGDASMSIDVGENTLFLGSSASFVNLTGNSGFLSINGSITSTDNSVQRTLTFNAANQRINHGNGSISGNIAVVLEGNAPAEGITNHQINMGNNTRYEGNTYTGGTTIRGGVWIQAYTSSAFGSGDVTFDGLGGRVTFRVGASAPDDIANNIIINNGASATFNGSFYNGIKLSGLISGEGSVVFVNNSTEESVNANAFSLTGANTYRGGTRLEAGSLFVDNIEGSGTGSGNVTIADGTLLGGSGSIDGTVISTGAATLQVGHDGKTGFSVGGLSLGGDLTVTYADFSGLLTILGELNLNGHNVIFDLSGYEGGEMELIAFSSLSGGDAGNFSVTGLSGSGYGVQVGLNGVSLAPIPEPATYGAILTAMLASAVILIRRRRIE